MNTKTEVFKENKHKKNVKNHLIEKKRGKKVNKKVKLKILTATKNV